MIEWGPDSDEEMDRTTEANFATLPDEGGEDAPDIYDDWFERSVRATSSEWGALRFPWTVRALIVMVVAGVSFVPLGVVITLLELSERRERYTTLWKTAP